MINTLHELKETQRVDQLFWLNMHYSCFADVAQPTWIKSLIQNQNWDSEIKSEWKYVQCRISELFLTLGSKKK